jgi:drug/metabolite transporter (DMT)-like permease
MLADLSSSEGNDMSVTTSRKPLDTFAITTMLILCVIWGLQQVAVKAASAGMHPIMQIGIRSALAALFVYVLIRARGQTISLRDGTFRAGTITGVLFALEFLCVAIGLKYTTASHMSVFLYTAPIFTVLGLHWFVPGERMRKMQWCGVFLAFIGIIVAFSNGFSDTSRDWHHVLIGDALGVLAGLFWASTTVFIRRSALSEAPPATTLLYQLGSAGVLLLVLGTLSGNAASIDMTGIVWLSMIFQSVIVAFISFLVWFWMLRNYLASRLSAFSFLTPLFGVGFGVLLLHDPVGVQFAIGAALVLSGVILANLRK